MDYEKITFEEKNWEFENFIDIYVIRKYREFFLSRKGFFNFEEFCVGKENLSYWKENGTWKTPPIILDVDSLIEEPPSWSEIVRPYQLVEGHTRLGHLFSSV